MLLIPPLIPRRRLPTPESPRLRPRLLELLSRDRQIPRRQLVLNQLPPPHRLVLVDRCQAPATDGDVRVVLARPL